MRKAPNETPLQESRPNAHCFVCGPENAIGLRLEFRTDGDTCRTRFTPDERHQGYDGFLHGGILGAVLDDVMANWFYLRGTKAVTGRMEIRYRAPVPIGTPLAAESWLDERRGKIGRLKCRAVDGSGEVVAEGAGTYFLPEKGDGPARSAKSREVRS